MKVMINNSVYGEQTVEVSRIEIQWKPYERWEVSLYDESGTCVQVEIIVLFRDVVRYLDRIGGREWLKD